MNLKTILLVTAGYIMLVFAAIGLFLPVWPTTPFVLVAAACFSCVPKHREKVMKIPFVKEHLKNYQDRKGLSKKTLIANLTFLWGMLLLSCFLIRRIWLIALLCAIGTAVTIHLIHMAKPKEPAAKKNTALKRE